MIEEKNKVVNLVTPINFYVEGKIYYTKRVCYKSFKFIYIEGRLNIIAEFKGFGVVLPIKETEEELRANNISYTIV